MRVPTRYTVALLLMSVAVLPGCGVGATAKVYSAQQLNAALLDQVAGMQKVYGPESGAYGTLKATLMGNQAMTQSKLDKPHCRKVGQIDNEAAAVKKAPAAVVVYTGHGTSVTEALISLPEEHARKPFNTKLSADCSTYNAEMSGRKFTYATQPLQLTKVGDATQGFLTTAQGSGYRVQLGTVAVRHGNTVMTLLVVGRQVSKEIAQQHAAAAYAKLTGALKEK